MPVFNLSISEMSYIIVEINTSKKGKDNSNNGTEIVVACKAWIQDKSTLRWPQKKQYEKCLNNATKFSNNWTQYKIIRICSEDIGMHINI